MTASPISPCLDWIPAGTALRAIPTLMMIVSVDNRHKMVKLISILRDTKVELEGSPARINALCLRRPGPCRLYAEPNLCPGGLQPQHPGLCVRSWKLRQR